jgi:hypothetical protein
MTTVVRMKRSHLAPCGINCRVCIAFLRERNTCPGCRVDTVDKPVTRFRCFIKNCSANNNVQFCYACATFPCQRIKQMDKRYRTRYGMSIIENLEHMKTSGVRDYLNHEATRWTCPSCGGIICVHKGFCFSCGKPPPKRLSKGEQ